MAIASDSIMLREVTGWKPGSPRYREGMATVPAALARARDLTIPAMREAVDRLSPDIRRVVQYHLGWIDPDGTPVAAPGGKTIRPALAITAAEAVGAAPEAAVPGAVAVELVHNFSLLHDDVMDGDVERRHRPTAWALMGEGEAILAGDALLALAQERLIDPPTPLRLAAARALSEATAEMITGQSEDLAFESRDDVTYAECLEMMEHKTSALLACACRLGAILGGGSDEQVAALGAFGRRLGTSFQAIDDVLGIWGDPEVTGKQAYSDLHQGKKSLPVVAALEAGGESAAELRALLASPQRGESEVHRAAELVEAAGGRARAVAEADAALSSALDALAGVTLDAGARRELEAVATFITQRDF
jgi:geranylgeranyl diphosphate synthase, type I